MKAAKHTEEIEETLYKDIVGIGNGAHINIPKEHLGKRAVVSIIAGHHPCQECGKPIYGKYTPSCEHCRKEREVQSIIYGRAFLIERLKKDIVDPKTSKEDKDFFRETLEKIAKNEYDFEDEEELKELNVIPKLDEESIKAIIKIVDNQKIKEEDNIKK